MKNPKVMQRIAQALQGADEGARGAMAGMEESVRRGALQKALGEQVLQAKNKGVKISDEAMNRAAMEAASNNPMANLLESMAGTQTADRVIQGAVYGSGMTAGAAGLIAIMQAMQGAQDNQQRRDYPLQK